MKPQAMKPRPGMPGQHRPNSSNQNNTRPQFTRPPPPFTKGPRQPRVNENPNKHGKRPAPYGHMVSNGQMMRPNMPMMGPMGPVMMPTEPMMGTNGPMVPPGFMDPSGFNMMMRPPPPVVPMPMGPPPMFTNGGLSSKINVQGPNQSIVTKKEGVHGKRDKKSENEETGQANTFNSEENWNYNYSQFGTVPGMHCTWPENYPGAWNISNPTNQFYYQNSDRNQDPQYSNQSNNHDYSQTFYQNYEQGYNQNYDYSYNQYYNQGGQPFMQSNYYNVKQEHPTFNPNCNQNGAFKNAPQNKKWKERSQKMRTHYCDTCDKSFPTEEALATHLSEHKVCGLDDCKFTAHPKVVDNHQRMQHFTGLYRRIGSLYTPEDIEKWRKDRKKNYPTPKNVEARRAEQKEMYARGERIGAPNNRFSRNQQRNGRFPPTQHPRVDRRNDENQSDNRHPPPPPNTPSGPPKKWKPVFPAVRFEIEESKERSGVKPFPGTAALLPKTKNFSAKPDAPKVTENKIACSSLSFLSIYGNSSSEEDSDTEESENSTSCNVEKSTKENSPSETMTAENDTIILRNTENSSKPEKESSNELLPAGAVQPPKPLETDTLCEGLEEKTENDCPSLDSTNEIGLSQLPCKAGTSTSKTDAGIQDAAAINEESDDFPKSSDSIEPQCSSTILRTPPDSPSKKRRTTEPESPISDPKILKSSDPFHEKSNLTGKPNQLTESIPTALDDSFGCDQPSDVIVPNKPICETLSPREPSEEMSTPNDVNDVNDSSDDSGPEEIPIKKDSGVSGDKDSGNEEIEVPNSVGGRKRRRQPRQPLKKLMTDEKQTSENQSQQQPSNKNQSQQQPSNTNQGRYVNNHVPPRPPPPCRRAPTLLEKLLRNEICHERNVILQCVRYVVEKNYFRSDRPKASDGDT